MPHCLEKMAKMPTEGCSEEGELCKWHISSCTQRLAVPHAHKVHTDGYEGKKRRIYFGGKAVFFTEWFLFHWFVGKNWLYIPSQPRSLQEYPVLAPCDGRTAVDLKGLSMRFIAWLTRTDKFPPHSQEIGYYFKTFLCDYVGAGQNSFGLDPMN